MSASALAVEPAYCSLPEWHDTLGPEVADVGRLADFAPDPEQELGLDAIFAVDKRGQSAAFEVCVICSRQNLKTGLFKQATLGWLFVTDERLVVWSAHEFRTVQEDFLHFEQLIRGSDVLRKRVKQIHRANGDEAIEFTTGTRMIFRTRTKGGGRGLSGPKVTLDEGFALKPEHMGALLPTLSAQPDPQVVYGSSAGLAESAVLRGIRDRGRAGVDPRLAYLEWCAPPPAEACKDGDACTHALEAEGCGCDNPELWARANPTMGRSRSNGTGISQENIAAERRAMPPAEFGRERMGWWDDPAEGVSPISPQAWSKRADSESHVEDPVAFALDVPPDRSRASIAICGRRDDGRYHGELIRHRSGTGWVVDELVDLATKWGPCSVAVATSSPADAFVKALNERGFSESPVGDQWQLHVVSTREHAQACGALVDDIANNQWRHRDQKPLGDAVEGARTRPMADAWAWSRKNSGVDISPLVAVTLARHSFATHGTQEPPKPFFVLGS